MRKVASSPVSSPSIRGCSARSQLRPRPGRFGSASRRLMLWMKPPVQSSAMLRSGSPSGPGSGGSSVPATSAVSCADITQLRARSVSRPAITAVVSSSSMVRPGRSMRVDSSIGPRRSWPRMSMESRPSTLSGSAC